MVREHTTLLSSLTDEQRNVYEVIMCSLINGNGGYYYYYYFLYGYGGIRKTFMWNTLATTLRLKAEFVLTIASSGIASLLLPRGRITHSRFAIPLASTKYSSCNRNQGSPLAKLLINTKLII